MLDVQSKQARLLANLDFCLVHQSIFFWFSCLIPITSVTQAWQTKQPNNPMTCDWAMLICRFRALVCISLPFLCCIFASLPSADVAALREIFHVANLEWKQGQEPCTLQRVRCDDDNRTVKSLILHSLKLTWLPRLDTCSPLKSYLCKTIS